MNTSSKLRGQGFFILPRTIETGRGILSARRPVAVNVMRSGPVPTPLAGFDGRGAGGAPRRPAYHDPMRDAAAVNGLLHRAAFLWRHVRQW